MAAHAAQELSINAEVLALPHHGGVVHNTRAFIGAVDPRVAIRSTGQRRYMTTNGIDAIAAPREYYSTADDGCVLIRIRDGKLEAGPWRKR